VITQLAYYIFDIDIIIIDNLSETAGGLPAAKCYLNTIGKFYPYVTIIVENSVYDDNLYDIHEIAPGFFTKNRLYGHQYIFYSENLLLEDLGHCAAMSE